MAEPQLKTGIPPVDAQIVVCNLEVGPQAIGQVIVAVSKPDPTGQAQMVWVGSPLFIGQLRGGQLHGQTRPGTPGELLQMFERIAIEVGKPQAGLIVSPW